MKPALHQVLNRIRQLAPVHKIAHLRALIEAEPKRSIRRAELESALKQVMCKQLKLECRATRH